MRLGKVLCAALAVVLLATGCTGSAGVLPPAQAEGLLQETGGGVELTSNRFTQPEPAAEPVEGMDLAGYKKVLENTTLAVYLRAETGGLRVQDKRSGYVWGTLPQDKPDNLNNTWAALAGSMVLVEAYNQDDMLSSVGLPAAEFSHTVSGGVFSATAYWPQLQLGFSFEMRLDDTGLSFTLQDSSIREEGDYRLGSVTFLPFFGSTVGDEVPGYIFVPDGCGALLRFLSPRQYLHGYEKKIYGSDLGIDRTLTLGASTATPEENAGLPLFGIVHGAGQNALLAVAQQGEQYGVIKADPAGITTDYNRAHIKFVYRQKYEQPISRIGAGVQMVQKQRNEINPAITYYFLTGADADYTGMARAYQALLAEQGVLHKQPQTQGSIPLQADILVADKEKNFIGSSTLEATGIDEAQAVAEAVGQLGTGEWQMTLWGWQKGGLHGSKTTTNSTATAYGSLQKLQELRAQVQQNGGSLLLGMQPLTGSEGQLSLRAEGAISLSQSVISQGSDEDEYLGTAYYLKPQVALPALENKASALAEQGYPVAIDDIGYNLYGEYLSGSELTRTETLAMVQQTAQALAAQAGPLNLTRPSPYLYSSTGRYLSAPMVSSQFLFETDAVPFVQIVLSGYIEMYSPYVNLGFYSVTDRLRMIDYNLYPSYLFTGVDNYALRNTASAALRSTRFTDWQHHMQETYTAVDEVLRQVRGQAMLHREVPLAGVAVVTYETGRVFINYNNTAVTVDGHRLGAQSAIYIEGRQAA